MSISSDMIFDMNLRIITVANISATSRPLALTLLIASNLKLVYIFFCNFK